MGKVLHAIDIKKVVTDSVIGIILGTILTLVPVSHLVNIVIAIIGILMIIFNGYRLYIEMASKKETSNDTLMTVIGVLMGFVLLCSSNLVVNIIVAIYLIGEPILKFVLSKRDKNTLIKEVPKIVLGVILLIAGISTFDILFKILGVIILLLSLVYLGINYYLYKKSGVKVVK